MCTAVAYRTRDHYFGRNLDLEYSYHETVTITPRNKPFVFRKAGRMDRHYAMIGMAYVVGEDPLYYEATNEKGLSIAGLNFPGNADYKECCEEKDNIAPFELIPWILGQCADLAEVRNLLARLNIVRLSFSPELPVSPLHWMISDREASITVECVRDGLKVYDNPVEVLTNNPTFDFHLTNLNNYIQVSARPPVNLFGKGIELKPYSLGMGGFGLPGDLSSASRFVRAAFVRANALAGESESESVSQFFHILGSVAQPRGCTMVREGEYEITLYSSCCNTDKGIYYYRTYENSQITAVHMHREDLEGRRPVSYPLIVGQQILDQN